MLRRTRLSVSFLFTLVVWLACAVSGPAAAASEDLVPKVWKKLGADRPGQWVPVRLRLHISDEPIANAWTTPTTGDIYISKQMLSLVGSSEGELAFILGHEIGHVMGYWTGLSTELQKQRLEADLSNLLSMLGLLFESEEDRKNRYSHLEEKLADSMGFYIINEACYNPYDAAAFFGRLQMYSGTTDPLTRLWNPYVSTYPDAGFPSSLEDLEQAGLIDSQLATGELRGYRLIYESGLPDTRGAIRTFAMVARPVAYGCSGQRSFFVEHSGTIRFTRDDRSATSRDSPLQEGEEGHD